MDGCTGPYFGEASFASAKHKTIRLHKTFIFLGCSRHILWQLYMCLWIFIVGKQRRCCCWHIRSLKILMVHRHERVPWQHQQPQQPTSWWAFIYTSTCHYLKLLNVHDQTKMHRAKTFFNAVDYAKHAITFLKL